MFEVEVAGSREEGITLMRDLYTILDDEGFESVAALTYLLDQPLEQRLALYRLPLPLRSSDAEEEEEEDENAVSEEEEEAAQLVRAWLEEGGAMCVQRAIRMHLARRRLRVQDERRTANQAGDFRSESKRFIEELMRAEDDDDVADLVSHGLTLLLVLPMEERAYIASVLAESDAAGARAVRAAGVGVIQRAVRGHQARAVVRRRKLEREAGRVEDSAEAVKDVQRGDAEKEGEVQGDESAEGKDEESEDKRMGQLIQEGMELLSALPPADVENLDAMLAAVSVRDEDDGGGDASLEYAAAMSKLTGLTERVRALWEELGEEAAVAQVMRLGAEMEEEQATILQKMVDLVVGSSEGVQPGFGTATLASLGATAEAAAADVQPLRETTDGIAHGKEAAGAEAAHQTAEKERAVAEEELDLEAMSSWSVEELKAEAERREALRAAAVSEATDKEKAWSKLIANGGSRAEVQAADAAAKAAREHGNALRGQIEQVRGLLEEAEAREEAERERAAETAAQSSTPVRQTKKKEGSVSPPKRRGGRSASPEWQQGATQDVGALVVARVREMRSREEREADLRRSQELRGKAEVVVKRRKEAADAAKTARTVEERTELARHTLKLDYSSLALASIPPVVFTDWALRHVRILWLNDNDIAELPAEIGILKELTQLRVFKNKLVQLPPEIGELSALQILWVQDNLLTTLPSEIEKLSSLTLLSLTGNPLRVLPVELSRLSKVREMELSTNHVTFPPPSISRAGTRKVLDFLRRADRAWRTAVLDLSQMDMDIIPLDIIALFPNLTRLYIDHNEIERFPFEFCAMTRLVEIRFDRDKMLSPSIEIWDQGIGRVMEFMGKFLTYRTDPRVNLKSWGLRQIPNELTDPSLSERVTLLDFSDNKLTNLPHEVGHMTSLTDLRLDQNQLEELPRSICWLSNVTILSATVNRLKAFPDHMRHLESLTLLHLDSNELQAIPPSIVLVSSLERITLCSNRIKELPEGIAALTNLRVLSITDNEVERIPFEFGASTYLESLEVDGNPIWSPPKDIMVQGQTMWFRYLQRLTKSLEMQKRMVVGKAVNGGILELQSFSLMVLPAELQHMPHLFHHLIDMNLDNNQLSSLPKVMAKMTNLTSLSFARNRFRVCPQILGKCYNVTELNFEKNLLTFLPMEIGNLTALRKLRVEGNNLSQPPMEVVKMGIAYVIRFLKVFAAASSSGEVVMSSCDLRAFPLAVADLDQLRRLDLSHNYIGRMPNEFLENKTVAFVDMSYNVDECEPGIREMDNLQTLRLSGNRIQVFPEALFHLTKLHTLVINQNELTEIPAGLGVMTWLKVLTASNNQIQTLPLEIGRLASLKKLNLSYNFIDCMPTTVGNLTSMRVLNIAMNAIHMLPPIMGIMTNLHEVYLIENPLSKHPPEIVSATMATQQITHLWHDGENPGNPLSSWLSRIRRARITKDMDAANFSLTTMPEQVLQATSMHLIHLRVEYNMIKVVPPEISALSSLTFLNLSHNKIKAMPPTIGSMTNLTVLYLNNNKIARLPIEIGHLSGTTMKRLAIGHNRLETPPKEFMTASSAQLLKYFATSEVAMLSGNLDWSWCHVMLSMRRVCDEVLNWEALVNVRLDDNEIAQIDWKMCLEMTQLETLELRRNRITEIPKELCAHTSLRVLAVSQNWITTLPIELGGMRSLVDLQVHGMALNLPPASILHYGTQNVLAYLNAIRHAEEDGRCILNFFDLSEIPQEVLSLVEITILELDCMKISEIPDAIVGLSNLARLTFNHNLVEVLPVCVSMLTNLTELELSHNQVTALLPEHFVLTNLAWLNIDYNPIKTPPKEVLNLIMSQFARVESALPTPILSRRLPSNTGSIGGDGAPASMLGTPPSHYVAGPPPSQHMRSPGRGPMAMPHRRSTPGTGLESPLGMTPNQFMSANLSSNQFMSANLATGMPDDRSVAGSVTSHQSEEGGKPRPEKLLLFLRALMVARLENVLDINGYGLSGWPKEASDTPAITSMNLNRNHLRQIPVDIKVLSSLTYLSADYNQIRTIAIEFSFLTSLVELRLSHNNLQAIPPFFSEFKALTLLAMTHNAISILPTELFQCTSLEILNLDYNMVTELPPELAELRKLVTLTYKKNPVIIPPEEIRAHGHHEILRFYERILNSAPACNIKGMECDALSHSLNLDEFNLRSIPDVVFRGLPRPGGSWDEQKPRRDRWAHGMTHLTSLSVENNLLIELPDLLPRLEHLAELKARGNALVGLPSSLGKMFTLTTIDVRENKLEELPATVSKLTCLQSLLLDDNLITSLPNGLGYLPELRNLEIRNNRLIDLPIDVCQTKSIKVLALENNPVRMPSQEVIARGMRSIIDFLSRLFRCQETHTLDLRALGLESIDYEILPIPSLRRLLIANNKVTVISASDAEGEPKKVKMDKLLRRASTGGAHQQEDDDELEQPTSKLMLLEYLNADHNLLSKLPASITTLTSLTELSLQNNRIEKLPYGLCVLTNLTRLSVANNPICELPLDFGLMRTSLRKLDIDIERLTMPPIEVSRGGLPIIMRYLADLKSAWTSGYLELMGMQLESIPKEITDITVLKRLLIDSNKIPELPLRLCELDSLTELWLSKNKLRKLPREVCEALTNLKSLRVNENRLAVLPMQIGRMSGLTDLRIHDNSITILPLEMGDLQNLNTVVLDVADMVSPYPEICERGARVIVAYLLAIRRARETKCVDLRALGLSTFPVEVYTLPSITALHLDDNSISMLPPSIERLSDLTELTLNNLQLQSLPFVMGAMTSLTSLRLTASRRMTSPPYEIVAQGTDVLLTYLRKSFVCVRATGYMNVSNMSLESLPKEVLTLNNLQHLQARNNHILHLSSHLGRMNSITKIHLHNNGLVYLPREIGLLVTLRELRAPYNKLRVLPDELGGCFNLLKLSLQSNLLSTVPEAVMAGITRVISLNISHNQMLYLADSLGKMHKLEKMRMGQNQMRYLPETIGQCTSLTLLSLTCNQLWTIPDSFANCTNVTALHISSNRFRQLPRCVDGLMKLRLLWAANNELIGLPTSLARIPTLYELQVKGNADLRYPPEDVVTEGREAIVAYLLANMRYEDTEENANKHVQMANMAESRAKDDEEAADLARSLVKPLEALAAKAEEEAVVAEESVKEKRARCNVYKHFDLFEAVEMDGSLTETEKERKIRELNDQKEEDELALAKAEEGAALAHAEASTSMARAKEAFRIADALTVVADQSSRLAVQLRLDADAQNAILTRG